MWYRASLVAQLVESLPAMQETRSIPGSGRSPGEAIGYPLQYSWASLVVQMAKNLPAMQEPGFDSGLGRLLNLSFHLCELGQSPASCGAARLHVLHEPSIQGSWATLPTTLA